MGRKRHETQRELFLRKRPLYTDGNEPKKQEEWIMQVKGGDRLNQGPGQGEGGSRTQAETLAQMGAGQTTCFPLIPQQTVEFLNVRKAFDADRF